MSKMGDMKRYLVVMTVLLFITSLMSVMVMPVGAKTSSRADLIVGDDEIDYTVSQTETYDNVYILEGGNLVVPAGATLEADVIELDGGSMKINGGTVTLDRTGDGNSADAEITGHGKLFEMRNGGTITLTGANAGTTLATSQGGNARMAIKVTDHIIVDDGSITATAGNGYMRNTPWRDGTNVGKWTSAGGSSHIKLSTNRTPTSYIDIAAGTFSVTGGDAAHAPDATDGGINSKGLGGGYVRNIAQGGYVGAGGHGNITLDSTSVDVDSSSFTGTGGNGGDAGDGGDGKKGDYYTSPGGGGGGGGYAGANGGLYNDKNGKSGTVTGNVGSGGEVLIQLFADYMNVTDTDFTATGGDGGNAGAGGNGAEGISSWYDSYSGSGGGGGYGGGGGGAYHGKSAGGGSASGYVAKGGSITIKIIAEYHLAVDGIDVTANAGNGGNGGKGGTGTQNSSYYYYAFGGGGAGMGGGGGGGYYFRPGRGSTSEEVASGGNVTVWIICSNHLEVVNASMTLNGGDGGEGGDGGKGGRAGGGGAGLGGGGGMGYQWNNNKGGKGSVSDFVGMGGSVDILMRGIKELVVSDNIITAQGGAGGDSGQGGQAGTAGGGGGGIGGGGGTYNGQGGETSIQGRPCDGGDVILTVESEAPSVATTNTFDLTGGDEGDGKTSPGGGGNSGGTGKGRRTDDGLVEKYIPMSIPHPLSPEQDELLEGSVTFKWSIAHPAWDGTRERKVKNFYLQIDNNSKFKSPDYDEDSIAPNMDSFTVEKEDLIGGVVYWRIKAIYDIGQTDWSEIKSFKHNIEPELIKEIPALKLEEDSKAINRIDLDDHFTDDLWASTLNYTVVEQEQPEKVDVRVEDDHFLSIYTVEEDWYGSSKIKVRATDKKDLYNESNVFTVSVVPVNDAPVIIDIPDQTVTEDQASVLDLAGYVSDVDNEDSQLTVTTDSSYIVANGLNLTMEYTLGSTGTETVKVTVSDMRLNAYMTFNVTVEAVNDKPIIKNIPDRTMEEDEPLSFSLIPYAKDEEDKPQDLSWSATGGELVSASIDDEGTLTLTSTEDKSGTDTITLEVTDTNNAPATAEVTVLVLPVNDPPTIDPIESVEKPVGEPFEKNLETYVSDVDNLKSNLILTSDSQHITSIVGFTVTFEYPLDTTINEEEVTFIVSDGIDSSSQKMTVKLKKPPRFVNDILDMSLEQGETKTIDLSIFAVDDRDEQEELVWSVANKGDRSLLSASVKDNDLVIKAGTSKTGATTLQVTVEDTEGFSASQDVRVTVEESAAGGAMGTSTGSLMLPLLLILVLVGLVALTGGYKYKLKKDRIARIKSAREARMKRQMAQTQTRDGVSLTGTTLQGGDRVDTSERGPSAVQLAHMKRVAPLCFACGAKTEPDEHGTFKCPKCGRVSK